MSFAATEELLATVLAFTAFAVLLIIQVMGPYLTSKYKLDLFEINARPTKFNVLVSEARRGDKTSTYQFYFFHLLVRTNTAVAIVFVWEVPEAQFAIIALFQLLMVAYVIKAKPFRFRYR
jgi:hypothetical protein